jgi:hypothetical protein
MNSLSGVVEEQIVFRDGPSKARQAPGNGSFIRRGGGKRSMMRAGEPTTRPARYRADDRNAKIGRGRLPRGVSQSTGAAPVLTEAGSRIAAGTTNEPASIDGRGALRARRVKEKMGGCHDAATLSPAAYATNSFCWSFSCSSLLPVHHRRTVRAPFPRAAAQPLGAAQFGASATAATKQEDTAEVSGRRERQTACDRVAVTVHWRAEEGRTLLRWVTRRAPKMQAEPT